MTFPSTSQTAAPEQLDPTLTSAADRLQAGLEAMSTNIHALNAIRLHWNGEQPAAFLSRESRDALNARLGRLGVNYPRLTVLSLADRMRLVGLQGDDRPASKLASSQSAHRLWDAMADADLRQCSAIAITDRLLYGSSYVTAWATERRPLTLTADNCATMSHAADPATGEVLYAVRAYMPNRITSDGYSGVLAPAQAVLYEPDRVTLWEQPNLTEPMPGPGWKHVATVPNPLEVVPVVPFVRRVSATDPLTGVSIVADVLDLTDAIAKLLSDALVTSEHYARPRRWATGLEIEYDDDGRPVDPFGNSRMLQSEAPETKFGQFDAAELTGYTDLIATLTQQIGALTGLPATYLGLHGDQPASADATKAAEVQLTMRARSECEAMARGWSEVAWIADAVLGHRAVAERDRHRFQPVWDSPEIRTQAQAADAAAKLHGLGVPLAALLHDPLGYTPEQIAAIMALGVGDASFIGGAVP